MVQQQLELTVDNSFTITTTWIKTRIIYKLFTFRIINYQLLELIFDELAFKSELDH